MGFVRRLTGSDAAKESTKAANIAAGAQGEALEYMKEVEKLPLEYRDFALQGLGDLYGAGGIQASQDQLGAMKDSALYQEIYGNRGRALEAGEEAIMRNQAMTGGLRSGNTQDALSRYAGDLEAQYSNQALNASMGGLQNLAGLQLNTNAIANQTAGIGNTLAQGRVAGAQAQQQGASNIMDLGGKIASAFIASDPALKKNKVKIGEREGMNWYKWEWNDKAADLGLYGESEGFMADEVKAIHPERVRTVDGYMQVEYRL